MDKRGVQLRRHAADEFAKSVRLKTLFLIASVGAIGIILLLDSMKSAFHDVKRQPYAEEAIAQQLFLGSTPELINAATDAHLNGKRYATTDEAFAAIEPYAASEEQLRVRWTDITDRYNQLLAAPNEAIATLLALSDRPKTFNDDFAKQMNLRAALTNAQAAEMNDAQRSAAVARARLKWEWDNIDFSAAKSKYVYAGNERFDATAARVVDADDPLSVIYDSLWYGALIIGVLTFAALLLSPIFHAVPVSGAEDSLGEKLKGLLSRSPRAMRTASSFAATAVGAMAIVGAAAALPSSPLRDAGLAPDYVYVNQPVKTGHEEVPPTSTTDTTPPPTSTAADPIIALQEQVNRLEQTISVHETSSYTTLNKLGNHTLDKDALVSEISGKFDDKLQAFDRTLAQRDETVRNKLADTHRLIASDIAPAVQNTELLAERIGDDVRSVDQNVKVAASTITTRADDVEAVAFLPERLGERPSAVTAFLGFDRYRVTPASTQVLAKLNAPDNVKWIVSSFGTSTKSGDDIRSALRRNICPSSNRDCDEYRTWINPVLRATRVN